MKNRILSRIFNDLKTMNNRKLAAHRKEVSFDIEVTYVSDKFDLSETQIYSNEDFDYEQLKAGFGECLGKIVPFNDKLYTTTTEKKIRQALGNGKSFIINVLYDENIFDIFDDIDEDKKHDILMDEDITDDIYVYGKIIKDSIKVETV